MTPRPLSLQSFELSTAGGLGRAVTRVFSASNHAGATGGSGSRLFSPRPDGRAPRVRASRVGGLRVRPGPTARRRCRSEGRLAPHRGARCGLDPGRRRCTPRALRTQRAVLSGTGRAGPWWVAAAWRRPARERSRCSSAMPYDSRGSPRPSWRLSRRPMHGALPRRGSAFTRWRGILRCGRLHVAGVPASPARARGAEPVARRSGEIAGEERRAVSPSARRSRQFGLGEEPVFPAVCATACGIAGIRAVQTWEKTAMRGAATNGDESQQERTFEMVPCRAALARGERVVQCSSPHLSHVSSTAAERATRIPLGVYSRLGPPIRDARNLERIWRRREGRGAVWTRRAMSSGGRARSATRSTLVLSA
jgi:hypothetical protein